MRLTLKAVNEALAELKEDARLAKGDGYFYFESGEAANWLDKTVSVPTLSSMTLEQWIEEFRRLKKLNREILSGRPEEKGTPDLKSTPRSRKHR
jgi:hypothetical protein